MTLMLLRRKCSTDTTEICFKRKRIQLGAKKARTYTHFALKVIVIPALRSVLFMAKNMKISPKNRMKFNITCLSNVLAAYFVT